MKKLIYLLIVTALVFTACKKEEGCTDSTATNYNADAEKDDGSCIYGILGTWTATSVNIDSSQTVTINGVEVDSLTYSGNITMAPNDADIFGEIEFTNNGKAIIEDDILDYTYSNNVLTLTDGNDIMLLPCFVTKTNLSLTLEESMDTAWSEMGIAITVQAYWGQTINCSRNTVTNTNVNQRVGNSNYSWFTKPKLPNILKDIKINSNK
tara:strand:+ start:829 stop:1455 length:627 start_codon:yes stop_codon:yes gene_type:complete